MLEIPPYFLGKKKYFEIDIEHKDITDIQNLSHSFWEDLDSMRKQCCNDLWQGVNPNLVKHMYTIR